MGVPAGRQLDGAAGREAGTNEQVESGLTTFLTAFGSLVITGSLYWISLFHVFWNALLFLTKLAKASMPVFVPKSVVSWWSGAPLSIM
jgi:hypothetical protein